MTHPAAQTILAQLGGNRFLVMTGASMLVGGPESLAFKLPRGMADANINRVQIRLDRVTDTYTVEFFNYQARTITLKTVETVEGVYADQLQRVFTKITGIDTHL
jgi:hypothetical protein